MSKTVAIKYLDKPKLGLVIGDVQTFSWDRNTDSVYIKTYQGIEYYTTKTEYMVVSVEVV